jgi:hypothetical protein
MIENLKLKTFRSFARASATVSMILLYSISAGR